MKYRKYWLTLALIPCVNLICAFAQEKQEENEEKPVYVAPKIEVVTTRHKVDLSDVPSSLSIVDSEEIIRLGVSVGEILKDVPGVQVSTTGHGFKQINIRGENNSRVLILVDGQKIVENKGMDGAPLLVATSDIERIEVMKGGGSVLYGSEAVGGVVNIITKKPTKEKISLELGTRYDSASKGYESLIAASGTIDSFNYRLSYSKLEENEYRTPEGKLDSTGFENENIILALGWDKGNYSVGAKIEHFEGSSEINTSGVPREVQVMNMNLPTWDRDKVGVFYELRDINEYFVKLRVDGYYQKTEKRFLQDMQMGMIGKVWSDRINEQQTLGISAQADFSLENHYIILGFDYYYSVLDSHEKGGDPFVVMGPSGPAMGVKDFDQNYDANSEHFSLFIQDEWSFADNWSVIGGLRGTYFNNELKEAKDRLTYTSIRGREEGNTDDFFGAFSLGLINKSFENLALRANVSQGFRSPNLNELYVGSSMMGVVNYPNHDLDTETSIMFDFGARYQSYGWTLDWNIFYSKSEDYIAVDTITNAVGITENRFINIDEAKSWGTEVSLSYDWNITENIIITPYTDLTYLRRKYITTTYENYKNGNPQLFGKTGLRGVWRENNREYWANFNVRYSGEAISQTETTTGWATCNFSIGANFYSHNESVFFKKISVSAGVDNIFDTSYYIANSSLMQVGCNFWFALKCVF